MRYFTATDSEIVITDDAITKFRWYWVNRKNIFSAEYLISKAGRQSLLEEYKELTEKEVFIRML